MSKVNINQLDKAETLPFRCNRAYHLTTKYGSMWNLPKFDGWHQTEKHKWYWVVAEDIAKNNIGKSFALAFSYYCKKVEQRYQYEFLELFISKYSYYDKTDYVIDDNGNIQVGYEVEKVKKIHTIKSWDLTYDYKEGWSRTINGFAERVIVKGRIFEFEFKDYRYYKEYYHQEYLKRKVKKAKKQPKLSNEEFRKLLKEKELKERQLNLIKIESHGFCPLTSFRK